MGIRKAAKLLTVAQVPAGTNVLDRFPPQPVRGGKHLAHSGNQRSAASGGNSELGSRKRHDWHACKGAPIVVPQRCKVESPVLTGNRGAKRRETCSNQWFTTDLKASAQQCTQLVDQLAEQRQRVVDGRGRAHVDAHVAQQLDRLFRATAGEELLVVLDGALALAQNAVGDGDGGGETRRVLEDIVIVVEVRDACPLKRDLVVGDHRIAEVELVER